MELKKVEEGPIWLFTIECSESEVEYLAVALDYLLEKLSAKDLHREISGAKWGEDAPSTLRFAKRMHFQLMRMLTRYRPEAVLSPRLRTWAPSEQLRKELFE